jgi:hypothetical protein
MNPTAIALEGPSSSTQPNLLQTVVDPAALTLTAEGWYGPSINLQAFQQNVIVTFNGVQYVAFYDRARQVCVGRRMSGCATWEVLRLVDSVFHNGLRDGGRKADAPPFDAHNTISMGISPADGALHLAYDHHSNPLRYRRSKSGFAGTAARVPFTLDSFLPETSVLGDGPVAAVTYPQFTPTPEGGLFLTFRVGTSGKGDLHVARYAAGNPRWTNHANFISGEKSWTDSFGPSQFRNAYTNGPEFDSSGRLHTVWVWRENTQGANHDICYLYSDDRGETWMDDRGAARAKLSAGTFIDVETPGHVVVPIDRRQSLMNEPDVKLDSARRVHAIIWHRVPGRGTQIPWDRFSSAYFHYFRAGPGDWQRRQLPGPVGTRPRIAFDAADNAHAIHIAPPATGDKTGALYGAGDLVVCRATARSGYTDWAEIRRLPGRFIGDPGVDAPRLTREGVLSVVLQDAPTSSMQPTAFRVADFTLG